MRRKSKTSAAEELILVASKLPWWLALVLGALSYFALHAFASQPATSAPTSSVQVTSLMVTAVLKGLATAGQFILPILFMATALLSWVKQRKNGSVSKAATDFSSEQHQANASISPSCPLCSSQMIRRDAKRGPNSGKSFWGCSAYPKCKGTRAAD